MRLEDKGPGFHAELIAELSRRASADSEASRDGDSDKRRLAAQNEASRALLLYAMPWLPEESSLVELAKAATLLLTMRDDLRQSLTDALGD